MTFKCSHIPSPYVIKHPERIETPRLLVFRDRVRHNIDTMSEMIRHIDPDLDLSCLCPHVKTHKSGWTTRQQLQAGISWFKATPNEIDMLAEQGVPHIMIAYPLLPHTAQRCSRTIASHPHIDWSVQVSHPDHIDILSQVDRSWSVWIDLDVGMHRTGTPPENAVALAQQVQRTPRFSLCGIHGYDGHNHDPDPVQQQQESRASMACLLETVNTLEAEGIRIPRVMAAGTPSAFHDLTLLREALSPERILISPGTWIYFDTVSMELMSQPFLPAAVILAQVIDISSDTATLNLGHKRWSIDQGVPDLTSLKNTKIVRWSEEHTVLDTTSSHQPSIGDYVMIVTKHVCSTVNLWEHFCLIGVNGDIERPYVPIEARNR
jgi:D-serine deaminase-like pyridoxal phosphate-dependent protein